MQRNAAAATAAAPSAHHGEETETDRQRQAQKNGAATRPHTQTHSPKGAENQGSKLAGAAGGD